MLHLSRYFCKPISTCSLEDLAISNWMSIFVAYTIQWLFHHSVVSISAVIKYFFSINSRMVFYSLKCQLHTKAIRAEIMGVICDLIAVDMLHKSLSHVHRTSLIAGVFSVSQSLVSLCPSWRQFLFHCSISSKKFKLIFCKKNVRIFSTRNIETRK